MVVEMETSPNEWKDKGEDYMGKATNLLVMQGLWKMEGSKGFRSKIHLLWLFLQFGIYIFCLFVGECKMVKWSNCFMCFLCFSMCCGPYVFMIVDVIVLLQHFSYNLTRARDFILKSLSPIICQLLEEWYVLIWWWYENKKGNLTRTWEATKSYAIWTEVSGNGLWLLEE